MPIIFRIGPFRIVIFVNDHEPPHVHCIGKGERAVIEIKSGLIRSNKGVHDKDLKKLTGFIKEQSDVLLTEWRYFHGEEENKKTDID
jgi:hypothetical protein